MASSSQLLLALLVGAASADVTVRFTANFGDAVYSTSSGVYQNCRGGEYRAYALAASPGLRVDGGGVAYECGLFGSSTTNFEKCAQVFAAMGYDGWALNKNDMAASSREAFVNAVMAAGGTKPVASNYDTTYTRQYANLGAGKYLVKMSAIISSVGQ